ncbi:hypothetical protein V8B55DRAFT_1469585 [Mucor lusitanicus]|uniref:F-box domain-containing protein n=2 Tax=Mucor circinelloides f. lusitanicus TaxID=29924 RepID=A0A162QCH6_MUCCL|nr:hypothetical protein FB192DRAFT_1404893 [Mucor lusitanicus]OAD00810.1 hypothetical protein MUCCIDRAFT_112223 [Mucor lusitanicus CBS 277.49]
MDVSWQTLPNEVLWLIFTAIEKTNDLVQLQQVCKHWSHLAYQRLYHTACIDQTPFLMPYARTLQHSTYQPRYLVMAIDLGNYFPTSDGARSGKYKKFIHRVARLCPYIVRITAGLNAPSKSFYQAVLELHQQGYLQHVQCLPDFSYKDAYKSETEYYRLVTAMKASLTRVSIAKNPFSKIYGHHPEINLWEHLKTFPRLEELGVSYKDDGFLYEADAFIAKCIAPAVNIHVHLKGFSEFLSEPLDLVTMTPAQPQVKRLDVDIFRFIVKDLDYIMYKFTGLESFSIKNTRDQRNEFILIQPEGGNAGLLHMCLKLFQFLVSLKRFMVSKLWFPSFNIGLFSFWAQHPQLKALTISKCSMFEAEAAYMTVLSRDKGAGFKLTSDFEDIKDGAYEMKLDLNHFNFALYYSQILELFKGNTIEALCLCDITATGPADTESERRKSVGNSLGYVIDHYTAINDIQIHRANCHTMNAHTVKKQLQRLTFKQCSIHPHALRQLSGSVERIQKLILNEVVMVNADQQNHSFNINMPQTIIDDLRIINYAARVYLVKLCVSEPSPVTRYLQIQADDVAYMEPDTYSAMCLTSKYHLDCIVVHINCRALKTFGTSYHRCFNLINE